MEGTGKNFGPRMAHYDFNTGVAHIIENCFLPLSYICTANPDSSLMIKVFEPVTGRVELLVTATA